MSQGRIDSSVVSLVRGLLEDPSPQESPSVKEALDRAYDEYCCRIEAGEALDPDSFCRRFPDCAEALRRLLSVHEFFSHNPETVPGPHPDWPEPGQTLDRYAVLAELGRGASGRAYLAEELDVAHRLSVIKVSSDGIFESNIMGGLEHPNIVPIRAARQDPISGWAIICMPYLGRVTLLGVLQWLALDKRRRACARSILEAIEALSRGRPACGGPVPSRTFLDRARFADGAAYLAWQLAEGLACAHSKGVCHSDLKPSNVLLTPGGTPMLLDFNLAYDLQAVKRRLGGTLSYMAPEQARAMARSDGDRTGVDHRSDIFSLGAILYELLAGRFPFPEIPLGQPWAEICGQLVEQRRRQRLSLRETDPSIDPALAHLVDRCLAFDPAERPANAGELAAALRRYIYWPNRARRWRRRHSRWVASATISCALLVGGEGYALLARPPYSVRQLNEGWEHYSQGQFEAAGASFTRAIERDEGLAAAYFGRARALEKAGRRRLALEDYDRAVAIRPDPQVLACRAHCWAMEGFLEESIQDGSAAIQMGLKSPPVYNNLGYCLLRRNKFALARRTLDEAMWSEPGPYQALRNRALTELQWAMSDPRHPIDAQAVRDIEAALAAGPPSVSLFLDAARILSRADNGSGGYRSRVLGCLVQALDLGADPALVRADFPGFVASLPARATPAPSPPKAIRSLADHLIDPLPDDRLPRESGR